MKETLNVIISNLVDDKDAVEINEVNGEKSIIFEVKVAEGDMGKVIGKQGRLAKSIRTVIKSLAAREHKKVSVEFCRIIEV
ncbi:MAG: KH domain-containing protein [Clostridia bacterium]|nr:KH domain-containing protein [Clostridia bacterium]